MSIYDYQAAFGAADQTTEAMRKARESWKKLYYGTAADGEDTCQRLAYTIVTKLTRAAFSEYKATAPEEATQAVLDALGQIHQRAFATALVEGECYLKPWPGQDGFSFEVVPASQVLIFAQDSFGAPRDLGLVECSSLGQDYFTLLERRSLDPAGLLTISYRLYKSRSADKLGQPVDLATHPQYAGLPQKLTFPEPVAGLGLVGVQVPGINCVDGSSRGVSVFGAAEGLIHNIDENERQLREEFARGESRIIASKDMLTQGQLRDHLFVGLDEDPENVGITVYSPQLRHEAYLERKREYLRNVESLVGLRRGTLSDADAEDRTATEIASSTADMNLTVLQLQRMWQQAVVQAVALCGVLAPLYRLPVPQGEISVDWGNGVLYDESVQWQSYLEMVRAGILKPEVALGWRFGMAAETADQQAAIREKLMPAQ